MASAAAVSALLRAYRPHLSSAQEQAAYAVHLTLLASGFELVASGERAEGAAPRGAGGTGPATSEDPLQGWNVIPGVYSFLYSLPQPSGAAPGPSPGQQQQQKQQEGGGEVQGTPLPLAALKCITVGDSMMVDACRQEEGEGPAREEGARKEPRVYHAEFRIADHIAQSYGAPAQGCPAPEGQSMPQTPLFRDLDGLVRLISRTICEPLLRAGESRGTLQSAHATDAQNSQAQGQRQQQRQEEPVRPRPQPVPGPGPGLVYPPVPAGGPGFGDDLTPGGGAGILPPGGGPRVPVGGSGMLVGPHDPRWGVARPPPALDDPDRIYDDDRLGPRPPFVPPGARFDPFGPPGVPGFEPGRFGGDRGRRGPPGFHSDLQPFL